MCQQQFRIICFLNLLLFLFTLSCTVGCSTKVMRPIPAFTISKVIFAKGIDTNGVNDFLLKPTQNFYTTDSEIIAYVEFANLSGTHNIHWEWYAPDENLYFMSKPVQLKSNDGKYIKKGTSWHKIMIYGEKAQNLIGTWKVKIFIDNEFATSNNFQLTTKPLTPKPDGYAVIIGISEYLYSNQNMGNLPFADDDAQDFYDILTKRFGWENDHILRMINQEATKREIEIALESWLTKAKASDLIVLFWSGHGFPDPENPENIYFACYDTDPNIPATGYRMDRVRRNLEERNAKNVIVFADTCNAGKLITRGINDYKKFTLVSHQKNDIPDGWIFMVGADTDRSAIEHSSWTNGAFTHCLKKALSGEADGYGSAGPKDGIVTMGESRAYLYSVMPEETFRIIGVSLHPVISTSTGDPDIWDLNLQMK